MDKDVGIIDLTSYMQETLEEKTASTIPEFLEANIGQMVELMSRIGLHKSLTNGSLIMD